MNPIAYDIKKGEPISPKRKPKKGEYALWVNGDKRCIKQYTKPTKSQLKELKSLEERSWRDMELTNTDLLVTVPDHPDIDRVKKYRQDLRDYPNSEGFPDGGRPEL